MFLNFLFHILIFCSVVMLSLSSNAQQPLKRPPQYVLISFDGSLSIPMWKATRELAQNSNADFTYFISGVYFLTSANKSLYKAPRRPSGGKSAIGFGSTLDDLKERLVQVDLATQEGNKMSSHVNGHYDGGYLEWNGKVQGENWTFEEWSLEFDAFHWLLNLVFQNNNIENFEFTESYWQELLRPQLKGLRAPQLGVNAALWNTLARDHVNIGEEKVAHQYTYDSSKTASIGYWPEQTNLGTWNMPLGFIPIYGTNRSTIAMDYNFYAYQSGAKADPANADKYQKQMYLSYLNYFVKSYNGNRAPLNIGHHFSTWNDGAYWKALTDFAMIICQQPEVICASFDDYQVYLESLTAEERTAYKRGEFNVSDRPLLPPEILNPEVMIGIRSLDSFSQEYQELKGYEAMGCTPESHSETVDETLL